MQSLSGFNLFDKKLSSINSGKKFITTLNAHSYNIAKGDPYFRESLRKSDVLLPDGISVVWAYEWLTGKPLQKIAGTDLFYYEMERLQQSGGACFFLGSSEDTLRKIKARAGIEFPNIQVGCYSPPFKPEFSEADSERMIQAVNEFQPDVLFIGLTAPKQEKWAYEHFERLHAGHVCCIGAVFDFYAGTINRAPKWMISIGLEWLYRLIREPGRMWRRYLIGNVQFIWSVVKEKYRSGS